MSRDACVYQVHGAGRASVPISFHPKVNDFSPVNSSQSAFALFRSTVLIPDHAIEQEQTVVPFRTDAHTGGGYHGDFSSAVPGIVQCIVADTRGMPVPDRGVRFARGGHQGDLAALEMDLQNNSTGRSAGVAGQQVPVDDLVWIRGAPDGRTPTYFRPMVEHANRVWINGAQFGPP